MVVVLVVGAVCIASNFFSAKQSWRVSVTVIMCCRVKELSYRKHSVNVGNQELGSYEV